MLAFLAPLAFVVLAVLAAALLAIYLIKPRRAERRVASTLLWRSVSRAPTRSARGSASADG